MGPGYHAGYWGQFGVPEERMLGRFQDSVRLLEQALTTKGERFDWHSDFYDVRDGLLVADVLPAAALPLLGRRPAAGGDRTVRDYAESWTCDDFPILPAVWDAAGRRLPRGAPRPTARSRSSC